ncbi:MAG: molybdopterin-binding protein [Elusimicrobiota bacterium]
MHKPRQNRFKTVKVEDSVGKIIMHDITCIIPGEFKGPVFKKGHIVSGEDIGKLKDLGKDNLYIFDISQEEYHEDEAAEIFKAFAGENVSAAGPAEGKVVFSSEVDGLVKIDREKIDAINNIRDIVFTTIHSGIPVFSKDKIAGIRIVPLVVRKEYVDKAVLYADDVLLSVSPFREKKVGLAVTGNEVASGRIKDGFRPRIEKKISAYGSTVTEFAIIEDDPEKLKKKIFDMAEKGCELIILTGGMSVDPDDTTKTAIASAGVDVVSYGVPVLPGNMFMAGYLGDIPVLGVPACALFFEVTVLDLFLPYVFSDTRITENDMKGRGYGGYCRHCDICIFPRCGFGKC